MMRQKLGDPIDGIEDIFEPSEWINSSMLAGSDKAAQHGSRSTADIAAEKQPVATTYCKREFIVHLIFKCLKT